MNPNYFLNRKVELEAIADDTRLSHDERIVALCKLYSLMRGDIYHQTKCVTKIAEIAEHKENIQDK